jgi:acylphosphatase
MATVRHLKISGRVQGVGFRYHMERKARALGVTGWVRNRHDGTVEAMVQGTPEEVEAMIAWARQGPPSALVIDLQVSEGAGEYAAFSARPTE